MGKIRGYEESFMENIAAGEFSVDSSGRIWRHYDKRGEIVPAVRAEKKSKPNTYLQVRFYLGDGTRVFASAHRVVYRALKGVIPPGEEINHDNGIKDDNRPSNLFPESVSGNRLHAARSGLLDQFGQKNPCAKLTDNEVAQIRLAYSKGGFTMKQLGDRFGVHFQHISRIVRGQRRPKQLGPTASVDLRHSASDRDPVTGQFVASEVNA